MVQWHQNPSLLLQLKGLAEERKDLREKNLFEADEVRPPEDATEAPPEEAVRARTADGTWNDLGCKHMGAKGTGFGRNAPIEKTSPDLKRLLDPDPRVISERLMARDEFKPAGIINGLAAAWLQFENHNWFFHGDGVPDRTIDIPLQEGDDFPENPMRIRSTIPINGGEIASGCPAPVFANQETHWWDGSQIYGSGKDRQDEMRTFVDGKIKVGDDGRLLKSSIPGIDLTGMKENYWVGVGLLHTMFSREHNAVCDELKKAYPSLSDQRLFELGVLVVSALIAKIHTVEWTPCVLRHPALQIGMYANWYGALGETFRSKVGRIGDSETLSGIIGSSADHHSAPFSLTEEFVSVYRMHPLIADDWDFYSLESGEFLEHRDFTELQGMYTRDFMDTMEMGDMWYSFGLASAGAVCLKNYPNALRKLTRVDGQVTDLATLDIVRDRERGIPRYNDFREVLRMPRRKSFDDITPNKAWAKELAEIYKGDVNAVDLQIGMQAEKPPKGFGFSDTAFRIFILMASRRLKSDRFFTEDYRPEVYTQVGLDWVNNTSMKDVMLRHYPELETVVGDVERVFAPWPQLGEAPPGKRNPVIRLADTVKSYMPLG
ncbi:MULTISPECIES: peroxidase family protein [unclassified Nocardioides]|uniref:peroxidase family protein n=1 Tax=unclassified Nocardioides TaxID=2615069 RepID=UPI0006FB740D|nr:MULTISPECIES: peroxidase family protein [unclassified Nocardioides]KRA28123.1 peroxidase [Nocardioides sp. Root614]KRA86097.1 peroxidase [Nocardioides sp. Root682]